MKRILRVARLEYIVVLENPLDTPTTKEFKASVEFKARPTPKEYDVIVSVGPFRVTNLSTGTPTIKKATDLLDQYVEQLEAERKI